MTLNLFRWGYVTKRIKDEDDTRRNFDLEIKSDYRVEKNNLGLGGRELF